jgi:CspA family cold shock protein
MMVTTKATGTIKWINQEKGFGIITPDGGGMDLLANLPIRKAGDRTGELKIKQKVSYEVKSSSDGDEAVNVRMIA